MTSNQRLRSQRPQAGFTLIEVMITVAIVAILSMVALPSYREYVIRGNIPEATSRLATKQVQMEQFFQDNRTYVGGTGCTADTASSKYFDFSCSAVTATTFTITAAGKRLDGPASPTPSIRPARRHRAVTQTGWSHAVAEHLLGDQEGRRMLSRSASRGFTIVELMIGVALLAIVLAIGGPGFATWMQNLQIRNMSEAMQNGIQLARAEAVRRNSQVRFQLVDSLTSACVLATSGGTGSSAWTVRSAIVHRPTWPTRLRRRRPG